MALSLVCRIAVRPLLGRSEERTSRRGSARRQSRSHDRRNLCLRSSSLQSYQLRMVVARAPQRQDGHRALLRPVAASKPDRTSQLQQPGTSQLSDEVNYLGTAWAPLQISKPSSSSQIYQITEYRSAIRHQFITKLSEHALPRLQLTCLMSSSIAWSSTL